MSFAIVIEAARQTLPLAATRKLDHVHVTFSDTDDPFAFSDSFADGSALIRVSTSLVSACNQVAITNDWARRIKDRGEREALEHFRAATTALRYYQLHQMDFGNSGKVHPTKAQAVSIEAFLLPFMFVMAHELAHHVLEHSRAAGGKELEFQADVFGLGLLENITTRRFARDALAGAAVALLAIELDRSGRFVRIPNSHPNLRQRWERLTSARPRQVRLPLATRLIDMVETAARTRTPLPQEAWRDLRVSQEWNLSYHSPEYFTMMEGFDRVHGFTADTVRDLLSESPKLVAAGSRAFLQGLDAVERGDIANALSSWSLESAEELLDPNQPLEFHTILEDIRTSALWGRKVESTDLTARTIALLCTSRLLIAIARTGIPDRTKETR